MIDAAILGTASFAVSLFSQMMPRLSEVRAAGPGSTIAADVRTGELAASALIMGVGAFAAWMLKDPTALYVALFFAAMLVAVYEITLNMNRPFEKKAA